MELAAVLKTRRRAIGEGEAEDGDEIAKSVTESPVTAPRCSLKKSLLLNNMEDLRRETERALKWADGSTVEEMVRIVRKTPLITPRQSPQKALQDEEIKKSATARSLKWVESFETINDERTEVISASAETQHQTVADEHGETLCLFSPALCLFKVVKGHSDLM
jgi:hypothetical protein